MTTTPALHSFGIQNPELNHPFVCVPRGEFLWKNKLKVLVGVQNIRGHDSSLEYGSRRVTQLCALLASTPPLVSLDSPFLACGPCKPRQNRRYRRQMRLQIYRTERIRSTLSANSCYINSPEVSFLVERNSTQSTAERSSWRPLFPLPAITTYVDLTLRMLMFLTEYRPPLNHAL